MREKQQIIYKGFPITLSADFSAETLQARSGMKGMKPTTKNTQQGFHSDSTQNQKLYRHTKAQNSERQNQPNNKC